MSRTDYVNRRTGQGVFEDADPGKRPSIVLIVADMVPPDFHREGEVNSGLVRTPNIDALRAGGVTFTNAFSNSPLCGPSRASYLTGRYPYIVVNEERAHDGWAVALRPDDIIFPEYLKAAGYVCKHAGKSHVGTQKFMDAFGEADCPWNRWAPPMTDDDGYVAHLRRLGVAPPVYRAALRGRLVDRKTEGNNYGGFVTQPDGSDFPEEATYPHYLAALARERLQAARFQGLDRGAPLYLQVDFFEPHQPFMIPAGYEKRAEELRRKGKLPESFREIAGRDFTPPDGEPRVYSFYRKETGIYDEAAMREYVVLNIVQMEVLDKAVGKVLDAMREAGQYDDSIVIFTADHGEMNGERGLVDKGVYGHPRVARVPFVVKLPKGQRSGTKVAESVCLLDLAPTVLEAAGVRPYARLDGLSMWPLVSGDSGATAAFGKRVFLFEAIWHMGPNPAVSIQWQRSPKEHYFYTYNLTSDFDELYDLADTSYRNLTRDAQFQGVRQEMLVRLGEFLKADVRWRCYWHTLRFDRQGELPVEGGDYQMFRPE